MSTTSDGSGGHAVLAEPEIDVLVIGAGFSGLYALHRLGRVSQRLTFASVIIGE